MGLPAKRHWKHMKRNYLVVRNLHDQQNHKSSYNIFTNHYQRSRLKPRGN